VPTGCSATGSTVCWKRPAMAATTERDNRGVTGHMTAVSVYFDRSVRAQLLNTVPALSLPKLSPISISPIWVIPYGGSSPLVHSKTRKS
jgi:hypothetical protein